MVYEKRKSKKQEKAEMEEGKLRRAAIAVAAMVVWMTCKTEAQDTTATCASSLVTCGSYLNATYPPASCCDPLKEALTTQKTCMCN